MEVNEKKVKEAFAVYMRNPYWKAYYDEAPTDRQREAIRLELYMSWTGDSSVCERLNEMHDAFGIEEWEYELKYNGNNPRIVYIKNKIKALREKSGETA